MTLVLVLCICMHTLYSTHSSQPSVKLGSETGSFNYMCQSHDEYMHTHATTLQLQLQLHCLLFDVIVTAWLAGVIVIVNIYDCDDNMSADNFTRRVPTFRAQQRA